MSGILDETLAAMMKNIEELVKATGDIEKILTALDKRISDLEEKDTYIMTATKVLGSRKARL